MIVLDIREYRKQSRWRWGETALDYLEPAKGQQPQLLRQLRDESPGADTAFKPVDREIETKSEDAHGYNPCVHRWIVK